MSAAELTTTAPSVPPFAARSVKEKMRTLAQGVEYEKMRKKAGIDDLGSQSYHMLFLGNPGTGETHTRLTCCEVDDHHYLAVVKLKTTRIKM